MLRSGAKGCNFAYRDEYSFVGITSGEIFAVEQRYAEVVSVCK